MQLAEFQAGTRAYLYAAVPGAVETEYVNHIRRGMNQALLMERTTTSSKELWKAATEAIHTVAYPAEDPEMG